MGTPDEVKFIVFFDGVCNLCNKSVQFIIKRDRRARFLFATLQSAWAQQEIRKNGGKLGELQSVILLKNGKLYQKSAAALEIALSLNGPWPVCYIFKLIPPFFRDWIYSQIAINRYRWFGKQDHCIIPTKELKDRFID